MNTAVVWSLRNGEHFTFNREVLNCMQTHIGELTLLHDVFRLYKAAFELEDLIYKHFKKMPGMQMLYGLDNTRISYFTNISIVIKADTQNPDNDICLAANRLLFIQDNYKDIRRKSINDRSAYILNFLSELDSDENKEAVKLVRLTWLVENLRETNLNFIELYELRSDWIFKKKQQGDMETIKPEVNKAFRKLCNTINQLQEANKITVNNPVIETELNKIADKLNCILDNACRTISCRLSGNSVGKFDEPSAYLGSMPKNIH